MSTTQQKSAWIEAQLEFWRGGEKSYSAQENKTTEHTENTKKRQTLFLKLDHVVPINLADPLVLFLGVAKCGGGCQ